MPKGVEIELVPLGEDHVRAKITWSEQDVGGGKTRYRSHRQKHEDTAEDRRASLNQMRRRLPCVSHEPLPIRLRINALDHGVRTGPAPQVR